MPNVEKSLELADNITDKIIKNSIKLISQHYNVDYYKQNPHLLSSVIQVQKAIYLETFKRS